MSDPVIELKGLKKDYGNGRGVFDVSFSVERGEVFGFLGPNGAGKTVTMRNLMASFAPMRHREHRRPELLQPAQPHPGAPGYLPGEIACMDEMTGAAFLESWRA